MNADPPSPPFFLGIDLGGTNIKSGVVDNNGRPLSSVSVATQADRGPVVGLDNLVAAGELAVKQSGVGWDQIESVGLGSPGTMDLKHGMLLDPPNLPGWINLPIRQLLADAAHEADCPSKRRQRSLLRRVLDGRGQGSTTAW